MKKNIKNEGKIRPKCSCGCDMIYVEFVGYYDTRNFWICENDRCSVESDFVPDEEDRGCYA